jgi:branched-chain amino acid transport system permease protein
MLAVLDDYFWTYQSLIYSLGVNGLLALSMYVVLSIGQLSLGQAAFMGLGAYTSALLTTRFGVPIPLALIAAMAMPALAALVIGVPTLRLSGIYLALTTIGLGEMLRIFFINWDFTGGALGLSAIPQLDEYGALVWIFGALAIALIAAILICRSRVGRAMEAMREDEVAAGVLGVDLPRYRLSALVMSAVLAGLAGAFNAHVTSFIGPNAYGFDQAVTILSYALLGGIGSPVGPVVGAFILTLLPELLRPLHDFRLVVNGLIIVVVVLFLPRGLIAWRIGRSGAGRDKGRQNKVESPAHSTGSAS